MRSAPTVLPPRRYVLPMAPLATLHRRYAVCSGTLHSCTDGVHTGWGDAPDALTLHANGRHRRSVVAFAKELAALHLGAQRANLSLAEFLHRRFPTLTVPPRWPLALQAVVDFPSLAADPRLGSVAATGIRCLKVKLRGDETPRRLGEVLSAARASGWTLRLDVNGGWAARPDLAALLATCADVGVAYVEDPAPLDALRSPPLPVAVDRLDRSRRELLTALHQGQAQVAVMKPHLWGSVRAFLADVLRVQQAGGGVVVSSGLDSPLGLCQLAHLAAVLPAARLPAGLASHLLLPSAWQPAALTVRAGSWSAPDLAGPLPRPVLVDGNDGALRHLSQGEVTRRAEAVAAHLRSLGVGGGARVATWLENSLEVVVIWHAVRLLGATWMPIHPRATSAEATALIARAAPHVVLAAAGNASGLAGAAAQVVPVERLATLPPGPALAPADPAPESAAALVFTSGSSGPPKGVRLSWRALAAAGRAAVAQFSRQDGGFWLCCLPLCHVSGLVGLERARQLGLGVVVVESPRTAALAELLGALPPRLLSLVPTQLTRLLDAGVPAPAELLAVLIGGAPCPPELVDRARAAGWPILPSYGMTETAAQIATAPLGTRRSRQPWARGGDGVCVGPPLAGNRLRVIDGEIHVRGPQMFSGYLGQSPRRPGAWFATGDLGHIDARGWLWLRGRRDARILRAGENLAADEIERALLAIPGVQQACVVGVPDRVLGERVAAWLTVATPLTAPTLRAGLADLTAHKHPELWLQTAESLPMTGPGKVARHEVRNRLAGLANVPAHDNAIESQAGVPGPMAQRAHVATRPETSPRGA